MKLYVSSLDDLNKYERENNRVSYKRVIERFIDNLVLCNEIVYKDESILDNANVSMYDEEEDTYKEIYQYYICNLSDYEKEKLSECGVILSYSDLLGVDVLMVDHLGTSWDYVLTDVEPTTEL